MTATENDNPSEIDQEDPFMEVILSRSSYRVGDSVVGTIRFVPPPPPPPPVRAAAPRSSSASYQETLNNNSNTDNDNNNQWPRAIFSEAYLFVAGWCRLDPRWHKGAADYAKRLESPAVHFNLHNRRGPISDININNGDSSKGVVEIDEHCVCFWTTNVVPLMNLKERTIGRWEDVKPQPLGSSRKRTTSSSLLGVTLEQGDPSEEYASQKDHQQSNGNNSHEKNRPSNNENEFNDDDDNDNNSGSSSVPLQQRQLAFTFRAELPPDIPHSMRANSCRFFYAVMVGTRVRLPSSRKQWLRHGTLFHVLSRRPDQAPIISSPSPSPQQQLLQLQPSTYPMGSCTAMAHSVGLPIHVTATDMHQPTGQLLVSRRGASGMGALVASRAGNSCRQNPNAATVVHQNIQTMRITDLQGIPCCVLTVMGVSTASPGSRMMLKFDFPIPQQQQQQQQQQPQSWTPCYQVSASLEGEEVALFPDGTRKRAQAYQLDTAHEVFDPECTERVCLSLLVPLNAPTTISTDIVQINVHCTIEITVGTPIVPPATTTSRFSSLSRTSTTPTAIKFSNLRLDLPCRIVHSLSEYELVLSGEDMDEDEEDVRLKLPMDELILGSYRHTSSSGSGQSSNKSIWGDQEPPRIETAALRETQDPMHPSSFVGKDIRQDLKILSLRMANECDLVERS